MKGKMMQKEQPEALRLADALDAMWIDPALCHHKVAPQVENAAAALRNLHTENTALRVNEENLRQELQECQDQRRAAFRRIEELDRELDAMRAQLSEKSIGQGDPLYLHPAPQQKPLTVEQIWENDALMALNAEAGLSMTMLKKIVGIVEAAHNIGEKK